MYARVTTFRVHPERVDQVVAFFRDNDDVTHRVQALPGFKDALMLIDRATGEAMTVTLWETEEAVQASAESARAIMGEIGDAFAGEPTRKTYEVGTRFEPAS